MMNSDKLIAPDSSICFSKASGIRTCLRVEFLRSDCFLLDMVRTLVDNGTYHINRDFLKMLLAHKIEKIDKLEHSVSAIYLIKNKINQKLYVGQAVNLYRRYYDHKKSINKHAKTAIINAFLKYGFENFDFYILEKDLPADKKILTKREQFWLDELHPYKPTGYNICTTANTMLGFKHSEKTKEGFRDRMLGHIHSEETKRRMSESHDGDKSYWYGKKQSTNHVEKLRISRIGRPAPNRRKIKQIENGTFIAEFDSIRHASLVTGISESVIAQASNPNNRVMSAGGYKWVRS